MPSRGANLSLWGRSRNGRFYPFGVPKQKQPHLCESMTYVMAVTKKGRKILLTDVEWGRDASPSEPLLLWVRVCVQGGRDFREIASHHDGRTGPALLLTATHIARLLRPPCSDTMYFTARTARGHPAGPCAGGMVWPISIASGGGHMLLPSGLRGLVALKCLRRGRGRRVLWWHGERVREEGGILCALGMHRGHSSKTEGAMGMSEP